MSPTSVAHSYKVGNLCLGPHDTWGSQSMAWFLKLCVVGEARLLLGLVWRSGQPRLGRTYRSSFLESAYLGLGGVLRELIKK